MHPEGNLLCIEPEEVIAATNTVQWGKNETQSILPCALSTAFSSIFYLQTLLLAAPHRQELNVAWHLVHRLSAGGWHLGNESFLVSGEDTEVYPEERSDLVRWDAAHHGFQGRVDYTFKKYILLWYNYMQGKKILIPIKGKWPWI